MFKIYVHDMQQTITVYCFLVHYADGTVMFLSLSDAKPAVRKLSTIVKNLVQFVDSQRLTINTDRSQSFVSVSCKSNNNPKKKNIRLSVRDIKINV